MPIIRLRRNTSTQWAMLNPILLSGEQGYESDTGKFKIGDGDTRWLNLEFYLPSSALRELINEALVEMGVGEGAVSQIEFQAHINSATPHPVYDDGPSLLLLYENAKV